MDTGEVPVALCVSGKEHKWECAGFHLPGKPEVADQRNEPLMGAVPPFPKEDSNIF